MTTELQAAVERPRAVLVQCRAILRFVGLEVGLLLLGFQVRGIEPRRLVVEQKDVGRQRQPGEAGADEEHEGHRPREGGDGGGRVHDAGTEHRGQRGQKLNLQARDALQLIAGGRTPQDGGAVLRGGGDLPAVRAEGGGVDPALVALQGRDRLTAGRVPDAGGAIVRGGDEMSTGAGAAAGAAAAVTVTGAG